MEDQTREDMRALLKTFGLQADEAIMQHVKLAPGEGTLTFRIVLEDITDHGDKKPFKPLYLKIEGEVRR